MYDRSRRSFISGLVGLGACPISTGVKSPLKEWSHNGFVALNFEVTGPTLGVDRIIKLSAVCFDGGEPTAIFSRSINPGIKVNPAILGEVGLSSMNLSKCKLIDKVLEDFHSFRNGRTVVSHFKNFELEFLTYQVSNKRKTIEDWVCTLALSRIVLPGHVNYRLHRLLEDLEIRTPDFGYDQYAADTGYLMLRCLEKGVRYIG